MMGCKTSSDEERESVSAVHASDLHAPVVIVFGNW